MYNLQLPFKPEVIKTEQKSLSIEPVNNMFAETALITKIIKHPPMKQPTSAADIKFSYSCNRQKI